MISLRNVKKFCKNYTEIENYDKAIADTENVWHCHHRWETNDPERLVSKQELIDAEKYYNVPAFDLIFMLPKDHLRLHQLGKDKGFHLGMLGKTPWNKGKKCTEISNRMKGNKNGLGNKGQKGKHWYNNGIISICDYTCPEGFIKGRLL